MPQEGWREKDAFYPLVFQRLLKGIQVTEQASGDKENRLGAQRGINQVKLGRYEVECRRVGKDRFGIRFLFRGNGGALVHVSVFVQHPLGVSGRSRRIDRVCCVMEVGVFVSVKRFAFGKDFRDQGLVYGKDRFAVLLDIGDALCRVPLFHHRIGGPRFPYAQHAAEKVDVSGHEDGDELFLADAPVLEVAVNFCRFRIQFQISQGFLSVREGGPVTVTGNNIAYSVNKTLHVRQSPSRICLLLFFVYKYMFSRNLDFFVVAAKHLVYIVILEFRSYETYQGDDDEAADHCNGAAVNG